MESQNPQPVIQEPISQPVVQQPTQLSKVTIFSMALFVLLSLGAVVFLYYQNQQLKSMLAKYQTPTVSPTPIATTSTIEGIYTNEKLKFSFTYPKDLAYLYDYLNDYTDKNAPSGNLLIQNFLDKGESQIKDTDFQIGFWVSKDDGTSLVQLAKNAGTKNTTNINIGGIPAIKGTSVQKSVDVPTIWFKNNGNEFMIQLSTPNSTNKKWLDQILSTFKFLGQESSNLPVSYKIPSDWTTTNIQNGVQLKSDSSSISIIDIVKSPIPADSLSKWYQNISTTDLYDGPYTIEKRENISIDGTSGVKLTEKSEGPEIVRIYVYKQNFVLKIELSPTDLFNQSSAQSVINSIKFIQ